MAEVNDGYESYYANRLWQLLPQVYRAEDSDDPAATGPLQELVNRIAGQVAVVRRSIDRLWADQSIETSDDWVIPYLGDLLDTNLVNGLDPRGQRLDVAKTIHYRRRKGTVAVLEEIARDVTGWDAHLVESFRRLSRTRHSLDPPIGAGPLAAALPTPCVGSTTPADAPGPVQLLRHEGLLGQLTSTPAGGFADLRAAHGASLADSPFDEYFHSADLRRGQGASGRFGISKLLVFLWRLEGFAVTGGTPVKVNACSDRYVFDPTGRQVPLFLRPLQPEADDEVDGWTSAAEWQVPGPLTTSLQRAIADPGTVPPPQPPELPPHAPYPDAADIPAFYGASSGNPLEPLTIDVWPELGQFAVDPAPTDPMFVSYQYGFPAKIGAGPYDRTLLGSPPAVIAPETTVSHGTGLETAPTAADGAGTVTITDSLTYTATAASGSTASPIGLLLVRADTEVRPVVRLPAPANPGDPPAAWIFTGGETTEAGPNGPVTRLAELTLDGLLVSGGDIVLRGAFATVRLTACTTDPGTLTATADAVAISADDRPLAPVRIWIEADPNAAAGAPGAIGSLVIDHCVLGPIRTRNGGAVESVAISDSIVQGIEPVPEASAVAPSDVYDPQLLARALGSSDAVSRLVLAALPAAARNAITSYSGGALTAAALKKIATGLTSVISGGTSIYSQAAFAGVRLTPEASSLLAEGAAADVAALNRALLDSCYPLALGSAALALSEGSVDLQRVTVLGRCFVHRLEASDTILDGFTAVEDAQDGCVRFSAVPAGSSVPRQYCSVTTAAGAALFTSTAFGNPGYGQLLETADRTIVAGAAGATLTAGAETGSEMGAFSSQLAPIKERGLLSKYGEYMPLGLTPVVLHVN